MVAATAGCKTKSSERQVGHVGTAVVNGKASDLRTSGDDHFAVVLVDGKKPQLEGTPPHLKVGDLHLASLTGGASRRVGSGGTNAPGGYLFSEDSRWLLYLAAYNAANASGDLYILDVTATDAEARKLGSGVTYMLPSPDSKSLAFVSEGVLRVGPIQGTEFRQVSGDATTASFSPDNKRLFFKRKVSAAGGLLYVDLDRADAPKKLADQVGDYYVSADSKHVAFSQRSEVARSTYDLLIAHAPEMKPLTVASQVGKFGFSDDGKYFAWVGDSDFQFIGTLNVSQADGTHARKIAEKVNPFQFAPDSKAIAYLAAFNPTATPTAAGDLGIATLPDGKPSKLGELVPNFSWGADSSTMVFISRFIKVAFSPDLMVWREGAEAAVKIQPGVFGYGFGPNNEYLVFRSNCVRDGRACDLFRQDLKDLKVPPKIILQGVYSFKLSKDGQRILVTYSRTEREKYDVALFNTRTTERKTLDEYVQLPAAVLGDDGAKAAYVVIAPDRPGLYVATGP